MRSSPFELEVDAPAEPLSMVARGAAELRWATERWRSDAGPRARARAVLSLLQASSLL
jgi:hypothetical protein